MIYHQMGLMTECMMIGSMADYRPMKLSPLKNFHTHWGPKGFVPWVMSRHARCRGADDLLLVENMSPGSQLSHKTKFRHQPGLTLKKQNVNDTSRE